MCACVCEPLKPWSLPKLPNFYWPTEAVEGYCTVRKEGSAGSAQSLPFLSLTTFPLLELHSFFLVHLVENPLILSSSFSSVAKYSTWFKGSPTSP